jgi:hypothetical protein
VSSSRCLTAVFCWEACVGWQHSAWPGSSMPQQVAGSLRDRVCSSSCCC